MWNLVTLEKCLNLKDLFQELSMQRKIFSKRILNDMLKDESPSLEYCMRFIRDILIVTKQNAIIDCF